MTTGYSEQEIETDVQARGLTAPRITPDQINAKIRSAQYHVFPGTTVTVCCLTLANGYHVIGKSAAASLVNFDEEMGRKIAAAEARDQIWALEGYLLREQLAAAERVPPIHCGACGMVLARELSTGIVSHPEPRCGEAQAGGISFRV
jgi:hypothetical protein